MVDDEDYEWACLHTWHLTAKGYAATHFSGNSKLRMHREIIKAPPGIEVDHIDGNKLNNCRSNLRLATTAQNQANRVMRNKDTGYIGVSFDPRSPSPYVARISKDNKILHIGRYKDPVEAAKDYDKKALELRGEFAVLNFPRPAL